MSAPRGCILAIDPGTSKCGIAVVGMAGARIALDIVPTDQIGNALDHLVEVHCPEAIVVGEGTGLQAVLAEVSQTPLPVSVAPERGTTLRARVLYFQDHPPRGLARLIPVGMRVPPRPVDDYAALAIALDWLATRQEQGSVDHSA